MRFILQELHRELHKAASRRKAAVQASLSLTWHRSQPTSLYMYHIRLRLLLLSARFVIAQLTLLGLAKPASCPCEDDLLHEVGRK